MTAAQWEDVATWMRHLPEPAVLLRNVHTLLPIMVWIGTVSVGVSLVSDSCGLGATAVSSRTA